ncbi:MAG: Uncharacterized protein AWT59_3036 [Candidatus Gallionella acididurans]|uniref:DUF4400 domain-containing protein n=1 Tax=Candidatus Gallionella acididurans TaxID=1796491 RepID=A0A139BPF2_9PROT|nr:MAG: Uncharacterized protein AWT59_3036 [Candidatus Gallionella acididurans]
MAAKKEKSGAGAVAWLAIITIVALMATWVVISPEYLLKSLTVDREFSVSLGGQAADQWIYGKMISSSLEQARGMPGSFKDTGTLPTALRNWAREHIITTWLWASLILYRANMLLLYFFILMPFIAVIAMDGFWVKQISTYRFSSQSPIRHRFGVILSTWTAIGTCIWAVLPVPIPSVVAPLAIASIGFATWTWLANLQKRI